MFLLRFQKYPKRNYLLIKYIFCGFVLFLSNILDNFLESYNTNKKVLLRERKRHTARRVASTRCAALSNPDLVGGGVPGPRSGGSTQSKVQGVPSPRSGGVPSPRSGGTPSQVWGVPHPRSRGYPIPGPGGYLIPGPGGYPIQTWLGGYSVSWGNE